MSSASIFRDLPIVMRFSVIAASLGVSRRAGRIHRANAWRDRDFPVATLRQTGGRLGCRNRKHLAFRTGFRQTSRNRHEGMGIDKAGRCLLQAMNQAGARFIAKGVAMEALVEEIAGNPALSGPSDRRLVTFARCGPEVGFEEEWTAIRHGPTLPRTPFRYIKPARPDGRTHL